MPVKTQTIADNLPISAPAISPVLTVNGSMTDIQASVTVVCPTNTDASMQLNVERSTDGGATWDGPGSPIATTYAIGGVQQKGANAGQPMTQTMTVDVLNPQSGDKYRLNAVSVSGGTFTVSATLTITS